MFTKFVIPMGMFPGIVPGGEARLADLPIENGQVTVHFDHVPKVSTMLYVRIRVHDGEDRVRVTARCLNTMCMVEGADLKFA